MKGTVWIFLLIAMQKICSAQSEQDVTQLNLPTLFGNQAVEISGLFIRDGIVFLPSEKCKRIYRLNLKELTNNNLRNAVLSTIEIPVEECVEIEGIAMHKNHIFLIDEGSKNARRGRILDYNIRTGKLSKITIKSKIKGKPDFSEDTGDYGIEGIAINSANNICYILKEKNIKNQSEIFTCQINAKNGTYSLTILEVTLVQHENSNWRFSDLYYDVPNHSLLCLGAFYEDEQPSSAIYFIDSFQANKNNGHLLLTKQPSTSIYRKNLNNELNKKIRRLCTKYNYSSNFEGITKYNKSTYIISDNCQRENYKCPEITAKKTLLLRIENK